jgi:predicted PurR-regulated permease PerM
MKEVNFKKYSKYFLITIFIILLVVSYKIFLPLISAIITSIILTFIFYPIYKAINKKIKNKNLCASIMIIIVLLIILLPLAFVTSALLQEAINIYNQLGNFNISSLAPQIKDLISIIKLNTYVKEIIGLSSKLVIDFVSKFFLKMPEMILQLFVILFVSFYLFRDGEKFLEDIKKSIPIDSKYRNNFVKDFKQTTHALIYGIIISGIAQGLVGALGFLIFGLPNPLLWGLVMTILAILPIVGPTLIWLPASVYLIITGSYIQGILLLAYGFLIISTVDNIIKPYLIGTKSKVHPVIILVGLIGGLKLFGLIGIIAGPLILSFLVVSINIYRKNVIKNKRH